VLRLEGVGDVLEEDESEDDVLVLGGVMLLRRASAACQSFCSKPRVAPLVGAEVA
jgi:hypothetical protein